MIMNKDRMLKHFHESEAIVERLKDFVSDEDKARAKQLLDSLADNGTNSSTN